MMPSKPDLLVLPFQATLAGTHYFLSFEIVLRMMSKSQHILMQLDRSYPGAAHAIGWTIFRRSPLKYLYENVPLFRFEHGARRYIRKAYAIHYALLHDDDSSLAVLNL